MDYINNYYSKFLDRVNFIELKDYSDLNLSIDSDIKELPLPIVSDKLAKGIKTGELMEEVDAELIIDGMIWILATDLNFEYRADYIKILRAFSQKIDDYIFFKGIKFLDRKLEERANIYFRALSFINGEHILGRFNYGLSLERIAQEEISNSRENSGQAFLRASTLEFESILDIDEDYSLAYYKLGYHYKFNGQFLKAKLMWEKFLKLDNDDLRKQEIREEMDAIDDSVKLESGLTYLSYNRHEDALELFLEILPRHENWWELHYLIGSSYAGLNMGPEAIEAYKKALEADDTREEVYNELGIELFKLARLEEAVEVFTRGLGKIAGSYKLYFNRGLGYYQLGDIDRAYGDISEAHKLNPQDKNVLEMKLSLDKKLDI